MSFNCRGLAGLEKRSALPRVVDSDRPDILLLQENSGEGEEIKFRLESWFGG